jgi:hypothetical protein
MAVASSLIMEVMFVHAPIPIAIGIGVSNNMVLPMHEPLKSFPSVVEIPIFKFNFEIKVNLNNRRWVFWSFRRQLHGKGRLECSRIRKT